ncbi:C40 family peptidase, partial [Levilactobacillus brevis]|nr:C40 family peptidase [Levilactobacillus brevis]
TGPSRFDSSGFTSYVYKEGASKKIPRTAQAQYNKYKHVSYKNIKKGDLVFFGGSKHSISHVGLYVGGGKMIDSQNRGVVTEAVHAPWWHAVGYARVGTVA